MSGINAPPGGPPGAPVAAATVPPVAPTDPAKLPVVPGETPPVTPPVADDPAALLLTPVATAPGEPAAPAASDFDLGDNGLNIAADYFVNTLGLDLEGRELTEAAKGNFHLLEAKLEVLGEKAKGSGPMLKLARESIERVQTQAKEKHSAIVTAVHAAVGGEANWKAVQQHARTSLSTTEMAEAQNALNAGGLLATAMAQLLLSRARSNPAVSVTGAPITEGTPVGVNLAGVAPLSPGEYKAEYKKLLAKYGIQGAAKSEELKALNARRV